MGFRLKAGRPQNPFYHQLTKPSDAKALTRKIMENNHGRPNQSRLLKLEGLGLKAYVQKGPSTLNPNQLMEGP